MAKRTGSIASVISTDKVPRKHSIVESITKGFETANISKNPDVVDHGRELHIDSTTFASKGLDTYYRPSAQWEGLHRYDTNFAWEPSEEKKLVRKVYHKLVHI